MPPIKVLSIFGTRPEAVKMAPVVKALENHPQISSRVCVTAQHRQMLDQVLDLFQIRPDIDLDLMKPDQSLAELTAAVFAGLDPVLIQVSPDWVLVQGDTTTVMAASLLAELVVAPPVEPCHLTDKGSYGGIREYEFE